MELERNLLHLTPAERENEKGILWQSKEDLQALLRSQMYRQLSVIFLLQLRIYCSHFHSFSFGKKVFAYVFLERHIASSLLLHNCFGWILPHTLKAQQNHHEPCLKFTESLFSLINHR